jgi:hypothetical protein
VKPSADSNIGFGGGFMSSNTLVSGNAYSECMLGRGYDAGAIGEVFTPSARQPQTGS